MTALKLKLILGAAWLENRPALLACLITLLLIAAWYFAWVRPHDLFLGEVMGCMTHAREAGSALAERELYAACAQAVAEVR